MNVKKIYRFEPGKTYAHIATAVAFRYGEKGGTTVIAREGNKVKIQGFRKMLVIGLTPRSDGCHVENLVYRRWRRTYKRGKLSHLVRADIEWIDGEEKWLPVPQSTAQADDGDDESGKSDCGSDTVRDPMSEPEIMQ